jgi:hypothetical protein
VNYPLTAYDILHHRTWRKVAVESKPVQCANCEQPIKGSHDLVTSGKLERSNRRPVPICCACMTRIEEGCTAAVVVSNADVTPKQEVPEGPPCAICYHPIKGTPYTLADDSKVCWNNVCRPAGRNALLRKAALVEKQQEA